MSLALYIVAEKAELQDKVVVNGKYIAEKQETLEALAKDNNVEILMKYYSQSKKELIETLSEEFELTEEQIEALPEARWFSAEVGLKVVEDYKNISVDNIEWIGKDKVPKILEDLSEYESMFKLLKENNSGWHFEYDY